jgi:hypothetical protein
MANALIAGFHRIVHRVRPTREDLRMAIVTWIEATYHPTAAPDPSRTTDPDRI